MKPATILAIGVVFIVLGVIGLATGGVSYVHKQKVVDVGSVEISRETKDTFPVSPVLSSIALAVGIGLVPVGIKRR